MNEHDFLNSVSGTYTKDILQYKLMDELSIRVFKPYIKPTDKCLQLGYFNGADTEYIYPLVEKLDILEGCENFIKKGQSKNYPNVLFYNTLFENYNIPNCFYKYNCVFALYIFEHVQDVQEILNMIKRVIDKYGLLFIVVPNANSLSRQLARHMNLINNLTDLTENDLNHGHRRVFDRTSLNRELEKAGFENISQGGILLKPFADFQMNKLLELGILEIEQIEGLYKLGLEYPDLCGSLFSICRLKQ